MRKLTSRNRRRTAADEGENRQDHERDDRNKENDLCDLDRKPAIPPKPRTAAISAITRNVKAQPSMVSAQLVLRLRVTLFINDQRARMFRHVPLGDGSALRTGPAETPQPTPPRAASPSPPPP